MTLSTYAAEAIVRDYCGWHISPNMTETLTLDGPGGTVLTLPSLHVSDISQITNAGTALDASDYDWSTAGIVELRCGRFTSRLRAVSATLTHGYPQMPAGIQAVIDHLATQDLAGQVVRVGQVQVSAVRADGATEVMSAASILDRYRLPPRP